MDEVLSLPKPFSLNIEELRRGNPKTEDLVADLYVKLRPALVSYVYHVIGSTRDAEDLVQVAFLQLFDQLNEHKEIRNIRGWLYRVTHNLAIDLVRKAGRRETLFREWFGTAISEHDTASAEADLIRRDEIERSLAILSDRERSCLMLRAEGLSYQEIADVLETTPGSVSVYLARGLKKFGSKR